AKLSWFILARGLDRPTEGRPVLFQHAPYDEVHPSIVHPLSLAQDAFADESQARRDGAAPGIAGATLNGHAMEADLVEQVIDEGSAAPCHDASPLPLGFDPVTYAAIFVRPIDRVAP